MKVYDITKIALILIIIAMLIYIISRPKKEPEPYTQNPAVLKEMMEQDALMKEVTSLRYKIDSVKTTVTASDLFLHDINADYQEHFKNLQKLKNEKFTIPNATMREQYDVISSAKYTEY